MKTLLLILMALITATRAHAFEDGCAETVTYCDTGCTNNVSCPPNTGCTIYNFTPICTGNYYVDAWTSCPNGANCDHCMACVEVSQGLPLLTCSTDGCKHATGDCCKSCGTVYLTASTTYQVKVCLSYCPTLEADCTTCSELNCSACVCLRFAAFSPCCTDE